MSTGQMTLPLPPYLITKHNEESRKVHLSVGDPTIAHQRAMWGKDFSTSYMFTLLTWCQEQCGHICRTISLVFQRDISVSYDSSVLDTEQQSKTVQSQRSQSTLVKNLCR